MNTDRMPVLVGVGQATVRDEPMDALSRPLDLMERSAHAAARDAGIDVERLAMLDQVAIVRSFREPTRNSPKLLARRLGAERARTWLTPDGGNAPQYLVNHYAEAISKGSVTTVLLAGAEAIDNARRILKSGAKPDWSEPVEGDAELLYPDSAMATEHEIAHGIWRANHVYPLFENALRGFYGETLEAHQLHMGELFARFTEVAASTPGAWFGQRRSAEEIAQNSARNRFVSFPHTKFMNAMNQVNQGAALLMTSVGNARALGIDESRWLYLHGCADTLEHGTMSERVDYHSSPAVSVMAERAFAMAGCSIDDMDFIDLYSCFPCAVEIARDALGIARDDPRPLTVTGGLPFHGGAGNNYVMNAIATMADKLRAAPGRFGLVTANGGYLTKHAAGIYSTEPPTPPRSGNAPWQREDPAGYQAQIDALEAPTLVETPSGEGIIETYTVTYGRDGNPDRGIVIGRLGMGDSPRAPRFLANLPDDPALLASVATEDFLGLPGTVERVGELNLFHPA